MIATKNYSRLAMMVIVALFAFGATSQAGENFTLHSIQGTWGFSASGTLAGAVPAAAVGLLTFDGAGGCSESAKLNAGGTVYPLTTTACSYTVNSDGSGSVIVTFAGFGSFTTDFVIVDVAKEFHFIISDVSGTVASGVAQRQVR